MAAVASEGSIRWREAVVMQAGGRRARSYEGCSAPAKWLMIYDECARRCKWQRLRSGHKVRETPHCFLQQRCSKHGPRPAGVPPEGAGGGGGGERSQKIGEKIT